jgi:hypothetical protein
MHPVFHPLPETYLSKRFSPNLSTFCLIAVTSSFEIKPLRVNFGKDIPHLKALANHTCLPSKPILPDPNFTFGISMENLRGLKSPWGVYDWEVEERVLDRYVYPCLFLTPSASSVEILIPTATNSTPQR